MKKSYKTIEVYKGTLPSEEFFIGAYDKSDDNFCQDGDTIRGVLRNLYGNTRYYSSKSDCTYVGVGYNLKTIARVSNKTCVYRGDGILKENLIAEYKSRREAFQAYGISENLNLYNRIGYYYNSDKNISLVWKKEVGLLHNIKTDEKYGFDVCFDTYKGTKIKNDTFYKRYNHICEFLNEFALDENTIKRIVKELKTSYKIYNQETGLSFKLISLYIPNNKCEISKKTSHRYSNNKNYIKRIYVFEGDGIDMNNLVGAFTTFGEARRYYGMCKNLGKVKNRDNYMYYKYINKSFYKNMNIPVRVYRGKVVDPDNLIGEYSDIHDFINANDYFFPTRIDNILAVNNTYYNNRSKLFVERVDPAINDKLKSMSIDVPSKKYSLSNPRKYKVIEKESFKNAINNTEKMKRAYVFEGDGITGVPIEKFESLEYALLKYGVKKLKTTNRDGYNYYKEINKSFYFNHKTPVEIYKSKSLDKEDLIGVYEDIKDFIKTQEKAPVEIGNFINRITNNSILFSSKYNVTIKRL